MRADNHQILQPMFVSTFSDNVKFDVEKTGLGFKTDVKINGKDTALPTDLQDAASDLTSAPSAVTPPRCQIVAARGGSKR